MRQQVKRRATKKREFEGKLGPFTIAIAIGREIRHEIDRHHA
jgi:hypothetical protein